MHKIKSDARREACKPDSFNPFARRWRASSVADEESATRIPTHQSESHVTPTIEQRRLTQNLQEQGDSSPHHANTMPSPFRPGPAPNNAHESIPENANTGERELPLEDRPDKSEDSGNATSDTVLDSTGKSEVSHSDAVPRRRRTGILGAIARKNEERKQQRPSLRDHRHPSSASQKQLQEKNYTFGNQIRATVFNSWINVLLVFVPVGIAVHYAHLQPVGDFVINFIAIVPLAALLSYATEEIALRVGETLGGLLNATFGNAVELIVSILALTKNQVDIVQESLIGSMLSNLLLVMGMSFFFGGVTRVRQHFNMTVAQTASSLLALAVGSLIIPAAFRAWAEGESDVDKESDITALSRGTAILLLVVYGCYLFFQLKTHIDIYNAPSKKVAKRSKQKEVKPGQAKEGLMKGVAALAAPPRGSVSQESGQQMKTALVIPEKDNKDADFQDEEEREIPQLSKLTAILTLVISTALVAVCAEGMVGSIDAITEGGGISRTFVGLILLPIVGNAAEHATAVTVATKDKMDLAIGVAVGSSMQIALLVIPLLVVLGWILGKEDMNLAFDGFQIIVLFVAILLVNYLIQDGESHWLEGVLLCILYLIIAVAAWYYPKKDAAETAATG